jgi:hypothetical protein
MHFRSPSVFVDAIALLSRRAASRLMRSEEIACSLIFRLRLARVQPDTAPFELFSIEDDLATNAFARSRGYVTFPRRGKNLYKNRLPPFAKIPNNGE